MACILVIDDEPELREALCDVLTDAGYDVLVARDGQEGLATAQAHAIDLVMTDMILPGAEGFEVLHALRTLTPTVKILAMSGGGRVGAQDLLGMARRLGAHQAVQKPMKLHALLTIVRELLGEE